MTDAGTQAPSKALVRIKRAVLPTGPHRRTLPLGIARGLRMTVDFSTQTRMFLGLYEIELNRWLRDLCRPGFRSFDVGGQFGYDALVLAKLSGAPVISFECEPACCEAITANAAANPGLGHLVTVRQAFIDAESAEAEGRLALDDVAFGPGGFVPDFMKLDIEGAELAALTGARRILASRRPGLLVETHSRRLEEQCLELLRHHGYAPEIVNPRRWLPDFRPAEHNRWLAARPPEPV